ncbi:hypothetical protein [Clostridium thermobutyricum]|uniref:Uncharacterized protein n=1 Tax=Clostridium thermobutyricum DSM 4928 TaxID=1121339 RepID=A0A1V4SX68_9CLOT|nr:hypothetical protein [Clostridium thermobutyricum]OPX49145.1 hypothetical protein CLTHE_08990 [Clostridium thermobutyricum DSM 4928]
MEKTDVLLRAEEVLTYLYNEINEEYWGNDKTLYEEKMKDFFIISNMLSDLIQYRYNKNMSKEEFKESAIRLIEEFLD